MKSLTVLLTNNTLDSRAGTELYIRDLAFELKARGHRPIAYSTILGSVADELRSHDVTVISDLRELASAPDVIHGQHHIESMSAILHFPSVPCVYFCHGFRPWQESAPKFPRIYRYVAVDHACKQHMVEEIGIPSDKIQLIYNFVDTERFLRRSALPAKPSRALVFSNHTKLDASFESIKRACEDSGIALDIIGKGSENACREPEKILSDYDLVFAKARAALEAAATGCAVVLCDYEKNGAMIKTTNIDELRPLNFGFRCLSEDVSIESIKREILQYDPIDAGTVTEYLRKNANLSQATDDIITLYSAVIDEHQSNIRISMNQEYQAVSEYVTTLGGLTKNFRDTQLTSSTKLKRTRFENQQLKTEILESNHDLRTTQAALADTESEIKFLTNEKSQDQRHFEKSLNALNTRNLSLASEITQLSKELEALESKVKTKSTQHTLEINSINTKLLISKQKYEKLRSSFSWRLTEPLRKCGRMLKRIKVAFT